jgi:type VI secretion system secreted protein VgrG
VLADSTSSHGTSPGYEQVRFVAPEQYTRPEAEVITSWTLSREIQPDVYVHDDYDMERPSVELKRTKPQPRNYSPSDFEVYDYPGEYIQTADGDHYATVRMDEFGTQFETAQAVTTCRGLGAGHLFTLDGCPRSDQDREHLIVAASYDLSFGGYEGLPGGSQAASFACRFTAMSSQQQFRPARTTPKPFVQGPQTAVVVGPPGDEIYTDQYGRVKVQFHWDRRGNKDENSSCWMRVSYPWAGKAWGGIQIPRIGQEVIVDFLEGDPDQPIITGRVYNAEQMPPYDLPANKTQSGMKSRSSKGGGPANFNEIRFEDKKGKEQLYVHAEKNQDIEVENDETHWVGHDRAKTIDRDETTHIKRDRTETVDNNETITIHGNRTETVDKQENIWVHGHRTRTVDRNETINVASAQSVTVGGVQTVSVSGAQTTTIGGDQSIGVGGSRSLTAGGQQNTTIGKNASTTVAKDEARTVGGGRTTKIAKDDALDVGKRLNVTAGDSVMFKVGSASIALKKDGTIIIKGKDITIEGSGKINVKASKDLVLKGSKIAGN